MTTRTYKLNYGDLPSWEMFRVAYSVNVLGEGLDTYAMELNGSDYGFIIDLHLDGIGQCKGCIHAENTKVTFHYNARELFDLLAKLANVCNETHAGHRGQNEWAGEFASCILSTLSFEWV